MIRLKTMTSRLAVPIVAMGLVVGLSSNHGIAADGVTAPADVVVTNLSVETSLTGVAGNAVAGREIFANRKQGNCLACHANQDLKEQLFHGEVGPVLDGAGERWTEGQLRSIVVNAKTLFSAETVMPGFYSLDVGVNVRKELIGKTILTAQQVEDVVAYLATLK